MRASCVDVFVFFFHFSARIENDSSVLSVCVKVRAIVTMCDEAVLVGE